MRMAIVSSYNESCGNASYTEVLRREFSKYCEVDVLSLPQDLLHGKYAVVSKKADKYIEEMCIKIRGYDYVNIQFEAGLFGNTRKEIIRRYRRIVENSKNVIVTMHRVDLPRPIITKQIIKNLMKFRVLDAIEGIRYNKFNNLYVDVVDAVRRKGNHGSIIVHTKREHKNLTNIFEYERVSDFPITFLNEQQRTRERTEEDRRRFLESYDFAEGDIVIGLFGFISSYKGMETAINALDYLPSNFKIAIFGRQHPMSIQENVPVDQYLERLITTIKDRSLSTARKGELLASADKSCEMNGHEHDGISDAIALSFDNRVFFKGELDDEHFIDALYGCDFAVLPYMETNQSGSGIASLVVESKIKSIFSTSKAFAELQRYYPDCFEVFDIGNYIELADKIRNYRSDYRDRIGQCMRTYNLENNVKNYLTIFEEQAR